MDDQSPVTSGGQTAAENSSLTAGSVARPHKQSHLLREIVETVLLTAAIFLIVNAATGRFRIEGQSMEPNLHDGEYVLIDKISYRVHPPERGDVVVFARPNERDFIKRVIGVPGDTVEVRGGQVWVNGRALDEPYISQPTRSEMGPTTVAPGSYFVMGDNRNNSSDSRAFGAVSQDDIVGRAWLVYWPPSDWSVVPHHTYAAFSSPLSP
jgi:signal peptidase I